METVERCELCGGIDFRPLMKCRDRLHGIDGEFQLVMCPQCGLIFINPRPDREEIKQFYPAAYGPHAERSGPSHRHRLSSLRRLVYSVYYNYPLGHGTGGTLVKTLLLPARWAFARDTIPFQGEGKILDIGAGSGSFLASMKALGWETYGVDTSSDAVERAGRLGVQMFQGEVQDAAFPEHSFDAITLRAVLEHVHHPLETLREVHRILKGEGTVYVVVPNIRSLNFWLFGRYWYALEAPRHLYAFSPPVMRQLAAKVGFRVVSLRFRSSTLGLRASLQYWYDDRVGFKGGKPFLSSRGLRVLARVWRTTTDALRLGDAVEYRLAKSGPESRQRSR